MNGFFFDMAQDDQSICIEQLIDTAAEQVWSNGIR